jgi:RecA/RadA recombinase
MNVDLVPTYVPFLDKILGGGQCGVGVHGLFGPTGVGKTHMATMIAVQGATQGSVFDEAWRDAKHWVLFNLHCNDYVSRERAVGCAGRLPRSGGSTAKYEEDVNKHPDNHPQRNGRVLTKEERESAALKALCRNLTVHRVGFAIDSGPKWGRYPMMLKIAAFVNHAKKRRGPIGGVVIDGLSDVEFTDAPGLEYNKFHHAFLGTFCRSLADEYKCPVWVTCQLSGNACEAPSGKLLDHKDAAGCKTLGPLLDAAVVLGTRSPTDDVFTVACTKVPEGAGQPGHTFARHHEFYPIIVEAVSANGFGNDRRTGELRGAPKPQPLFGSAEIALLDRLCEGSTTERQFDSPEKPTGTTRRRKRSRPK